MHESHLLGDGWENGRMDGGVSGACWLKQEEWIDSWAVVGSSRSLGNGRMDG